MPRLPACRRPRPSAPPLPLRRRRPARPHATFHSRTARVRGASGSLRPPAGCAAGTDAAAHQAAAALRVGQAGAQRAAQLERGAARQGAARPGRQLQASVLSCKTCCLLHESPGRGPYACQQLQRQLACPAANSWGGSGAATFACGRRAAAGRRSHPTRNPLTDYIKLTNPLCRAYKKHLEAEQQRLAGRQQPSALALLAAVAEEEAGGQALSTA